MSAKQKGPQPRLWRLSQLVDEARRESTARYEARRRGERIGPVTGLARLDHAIGDALHVGVHVLHGQAGAGKSALSLQVASTCGCPALLVTLEMRPTVLLYRMAARVCDVHLSRYEGGYLHPEIAAEHLTRAAESASLLTIADGTEATVPVEWIANAAAVVRQEDPHLLLVVDSLHAWTHRLYPDMMEYDQINEGLSQLQKLSSELKCAALVVCERNRGAAKEGGLSAGAGSRKIEYCAEGVWDLQARDNPPPDEHGSRMVRLIVQKNRHGEMGRFMDLWWRPSRQKFWDPEDPPCHD